MLDQILPVLGYSTVVDNANINRRFIGPLRWLNGTDEVISPYFKAADSTQAGQPGADRPLRRRQHRARTGGPAGTRREPR